MPESKRFIELLDEIKDLHKRKNDGYAGKGATDPWANFRMAEMLGISAFEGCLVRMSDKYIRVCNLSKDPTNEQVGEAITDTLMDLAVYSLIAICLFEEEDFGKVVVPTDLSDGTQISPHAFNEDDLDMNEIAELYSIAERAKEINQSASAMEEAAQNLKNNTLYRHKKTDKPIAKATVVNYEPELEVVFEKIAEDVNEPNLKPWIGDKRVEAFMVDFERKLSRFVEPGSIGYDILYNKVYDLLYFTIAYPGYDPASMSEILLNQESWITS